MAMMDYYLCDRCANKTFYDASLNYEDGPDGEVKLERVGDMQVLCDNCAKTHEVVIREKQ